MLEIQQYFAEIPKLVFTVAPKEKQMSAPYSIQNQNANKCPHGFPIGTCPLCSGMGGAPKDRDKPRRAGEMSYNECMAAWIKIQQAQEAKLQEKIDKIEAMQQKTLQDKLIEKIEKLHNILNALEIKISNLPNVIKIPARVILETIIKPIYNLIAKIPNIISSIKNVFTTLAQMINSASEKISSLLGEIKNFIQEKVSKKIKKTIKIFLSLFCENSQDEEEKERIEKLKAREIKKIIKDMFKIKKERNEHNSPEFAKKPE